VRSGLDIRHVPIQDGKDVDDRQCRSPMCEAPDREHMASRTSPGLSGELGRGQYVRHWAPPETCDEGYLDTI